MCSALCAMVPCCICNTRPLTHLGALPFPLPQYGPGPLKDPRKEAAIAKLMRKMGSETLSRGLPANATDADWANLFESMVDEEMAADRQQYGEQTVDYDNWCRRHGVSAQVAAAKASSKDDADKLTWCCADCGNEMELDDECCRLCKTDREVGGRVRSNAAVPSPMYPTTPASGGAAGAGIQTSRRKLRRLDLGGTASTPDAGSRRSTATPQPRGRAASIVSSASSASAASSRRSRTPGVGRMGFLSE